MNDPAEYYTELTCTIDRQHTYTQLYSNSREYLIQVESMCVSVSSVVMLDFDRAWLHMNR